MGMQATAYSSPTTGYAYGQPLSFQPPAVLTGTPSGMGMTQLPAVPRPPYLQNGSSGALPDLPTPDQLLRTSAPVKTTTVVIPGVFNTAATALPTPCQAAPSVCAPQTQAYRTAASFPVNSLEASATVPPPYLLAPWLYGLHPAPVLSRPAQSSPVAMPPMMQRPQPPALPPQAPAVPPMQPPIPPPAPPPVENKGPSTELDPGALNDHQIRSLNERLNADNEDTRADAAMELFKILDQNPTLSTQEPYSRYVNAFMEKILKDPSAVVRSAGELALQTGRVQQPSEGVMGLLNDLSKRPSGLSGESGIISSLLGSIRNQTLGQGYDKNPGAMTVDAFTRSRVGANPGSVPAAPAAEATAPRTLTPPVGATGPTAPMPANSAYAMPSAPAAAGAQLNYLSPSPVNPASLMGANGPNPALGQRLNLQEGYRQ